MDKPKLLFICGRNKWRSPTTVTIYKNDSRINVRFAGIRKGHLITIDDFHWADLILVMEQKYKSLVLEKFRGEIIPKIISLDIPAEVEYMDDELIVLIENGTESCIEQYKK